MSLTKEQDSESIKEEQTSEFVHSNGRPSKAEQITIEKELRPYFEKSYTACFTAQKTGFDIKTVHRYFNKWQQEWSDSEKGDFLNRCKEQKERTLISLENEIDSLHEDRKEVDLIIEAARNSGDFKLAERFYKLKLKFTDSIAKFMAEKLNLANAATSDVLIEIQKMEEKKDEQ